MSEPIKVGDLVVAIRTCCDAMQAKAKIHGVPWTVREISTANILCPFCGWGGNNSMLRAHGESATRHCVLQFLKRIPPLSELESEDRKQEIEA